MDAGGTDATIRSSSSSRQRQRQRLNLPPWMTVHHLPEYGIGGSTRNANGDRPTKEIGISTSSRKRPYQSLSSASSRSSDGVSMKSVVKITTTNNSDNDAIAANEQFAANRLKKDMALDTLFPPAIDEVKCSARSMSIYGMRLVMKEIDDCVKHSLKYSSQLHYNNNNSLRNKNKSNRSRRKDDNSSLSNNNNDNDDIRKIEKAVEKIDGNDNLMTLAEVMHDYCNKFQPDYDENDNDHNDSNAEIRPGKGNLRREDALHESLFPIAAAKYNPSILPVICVKCYPNVLDRLEITAGLVSDLSLRRRATRNDKSKVVTTQQQKQPCVCVIRSTSDLVRQGHAIAELLSQCITNDTQHGEEFASELQRQRKRMKNNNSATNNGILVKSCWSYTRSLVDWASTTAMFDSIIVILDDVEKLSSPSMDAFFVTLASLRSDYGVPICVVIIDTTPGGLSNRLSCLRDPAIRGSSSSGVIVNELHVPLPQIQLELFINRLFASECLPSILLTDHRLLKYMYEVFRDCDNSIVFVATRIKLELRRYFATPCAFLSLLNCKAFTVMNESRMKYIFGDEYSRKYLKSYLDSFTPVTLTTTAAFNMKNNSQVLDLFERIYISYLYQQIYQRIHNIFNLSPLTNIMVRVSTTASVHGMRDLLHLLGNARRKIRTWKCIPPSHRSLTFCNKVNEWIILAGTLALGDEAASSNISMARALVDNVLAWTSANFASQMKLDVSLTAQPRRDVAKAICAPLMPEALTSCSLVHATRCAFGVFQSRLLSLTEWYELYLDVIKDQNGGFNNMNAFLFAVHELVHLGFVRKPVTGKRGGEAYEKTAIIWGKG